MEDNEWEKLKKVTDVQDWEIAFISVVSFGAALVFLLWRSRWFS